MATLKDQLTAKRPPVPADVPGLEGAYLRRMNGDERVAFSEFCYQAHQKGDYKGQWALLVAFCLCDKDGIRQIADPAELKDGDGELLEKVYLKASDLNGLSPKPEGQEKKAPAATPGATTA